MNDLTCAAYMLGRTMLFEKEVKRMHDLNLAEIFRAVTKLLDSGWTIPEIERLSRFRNNFQQTSENVPDPTSHLDVDLDPRRLEFIRWLVQTGRISDC